MKSTSVEPKLLRIESCRGREQVLLILVPSREKHLDDLAERGDSPPGT